MTGNLVKAELRKILSTKVWWGLLIPAALLGFVINLAGSALAGLPSETDLADVGGTLPPVLGITLAVSLGFTSVFSLCLGITATAGEHRHQTITTTYLTAPGRGRVLGAKMLAFSGIGAVYALVIVVVAIIGGLIGNGTSQLAQPLDLLLVALVGVASLAMWTLIGIGLGSLISNQVVALVGAVVTKVVVENILGLVLVINGAEEVAAVLPTTASGTFTDALAIDLFTASLPAGSPAGLVVFLDDASLFPWWVGGLVLASWVALFALAGWLVSRTRDVL